MNISLKMGKKILSICALMAFLALHACAQTSNNSLNQTHEVMKPEVIKTNKEWKEELSPQEYYVLIEKGTEQAFSGEFNDHKEKGTYTCAACGNPLFNSDAKYDSGSGWPSFFSPLSDDHVEQELDKSYGMVRTEVHCARCNGHLGHVFDDGPAPTGLRYCINSIALDFVKE